MNNSSQRLVPTLVSRPAVGLKHPKRKFTWIQEVWITRIVRNPSGPDEDDEYDEHDEHDENDENDVERVLDIKSRVEEQYGFTRYKLENHVLQYLEFAFDKSDDNNAWAEFKFNCKPDPTFQTLLDKL